MSLSVDAYQYDADKFSMDQLSIAKPVWMVKHELFTMLPCVQWHKEGAPTPGCSTREYKILLN